VIQRPLAKADLLGNRRYRDISGSQKHYPIYSKYLIPLLLLMCILLGDVGEMVTLVGK